MEQHCRELLAHVLSMDCLCQAHLSLNRYLPAKAYIALLGSISHETGRDGLHLPVLCLQTPRTVKQWMRCDARIAMALWRQLHQLQ